MNTPAERPERPDGSADGAAGPRDGRLDGRVAVVTGGGQTPGAHIGNGRATAMLLAGRGARVVVVDRDGTTAEATAAMIAAEGGTAVPVTGDVTDPATWRETVDQCLNRYGRLDIVHHNVGVATGDASVNGTDLAAWQHVMTVNSGSAILMAQAVLPVMREAGRGVITNVSSLAAIAATTSSRGNTPVGYKMSKAALNALTQMLALENARYGIRVNAIMPGLIDTPMGVDAAARVRGVARDAYAAKRDAAVPLHGGMGSAWDVAHAAAFLASDEAAFITGTLLPVDGGQAARLG